MNSLKSLLFVTFIATLLTISSIPETSQATSNPVNLPWNLQQISIAGAWNITTGRTDIIIAVIDSGIDFSHPALSQAQWINSDEIINNSLDDDNNGYIDDFSGWDWINQDNNPGWQDEDEIHYHGTFIAGIIAANDSEVIGIAPKVKVMSLRVVDRNTLIPNPAGLEEAVEYATQKNAAVIIMSLDLLIGPPGFRDSIRSAVSANIPVIGVAGNSDEGNESVVLPGRFSEVIAVGASNSNGEKAYYSNIGEEVEILAPGGQLRSTSVKSGYLYGQGTSYAAPHVAGVIGLMKSIRSDLSVDDIRSILYSTALDIGDSGWDAETGHGILNASAAIELTQTYVKTTTITSNPPRLFGISSIPHVEILLFSALITQLFWKKQK
ncbi:hypothetical protein CEE45_09030 [Candidatus Heimdallarchaeota archaeon B3_Heim]|nr:MAG: hypothetical protein CEE45_09030 [Candidatus Heimdallarchaeota archaeon B3_Heim]